MLLVSRYEKTWQRISGWSESTVRQLAVSACSPTVVTVLVLMSR